MVKSTLFIQEMERLTVSEIRSEILRQNEFVLECIQKMKIESDLKKKKELSKARSEAIDNILLLMDLRRKKKGKSN